MNWSSVLEVQHCFPWCDHPAVDLWWSREMKSSDSKIEDQLHHYLSYFCRVFFEDETWSLHLSLMLRDHRLNRLALYLMFYKNTFWLNMATEVTNSILQGLHFGKDIKFGSHVSLFHMGETTRILLLKSRKFISVYTFELNKWTNCLFKQTLI